MECAYCPAIMFICLNVFLIFAIRSLSFVSRLLIEGIFVVALARVARTIIGAMFHPLVVMLLMSGGYFVVFLARVPVANLSLQYMNSINCIVSSCVGVSNRG